MMFDICNCLETEVILLPLSGQVEFIGMRIHHQLSSTDVCFYIFDVSPLDIFFRNSIASNKR